MSTRSSNTIVGPGTPSQCNHEVQDKPQEKSVPEIPSHWVFEREGHPLKHTYFCWWPFFHFLHHLLCAIGFGHASLHQVWEVGYPGCPDELWEHGRDMQRERLEHINIVAGLLLSSTTALCTTVPPENTILPYTMTGPYCVLLVSVGLSLGGLVVGSTAAFVIHKAKVDWFNETMMGSRFRIWATMILLSFPFMSIGTATCATATALLVAAAYSEVVFVRTLCYFVILPPIMCGIAFGWMLSMRTGIFGRLMMRLVHLTS